MYEEGRDGFSKAQIFWTNGLPSQWPMADQRRMFVKVRSS